MLTKLVSVSGGVLTVGRVRLYWTNMDGVYLPAASGLHEPRVHG